MFMLPFFFFNNTPIDCMDLSHSKKEFKNILKINCTSLSTYSCFITTLEESDSQSETILTGPSMTTGRKRKKGLQQIYGQRPGPKSVEHTINFSALLLTSAWCLVFEHNVAFSSQNSFASYATLKNKGNFLLCPS